MLIEFAARLHTGRWTDTQAKAGACPLLPAACRPFPLEEMGRSFFGKPCPCRPADSLRCLPVSAVRPILYSNLQSDHTKFLYFVEFCFFRWRTAVSFFSSIDRFQLVCFARVAACPPFLEDALPLCRLRRHSCPTLLSASLTFSHAVGNHPHCGESPSPS